MLVLGNFGEEVRQGGQVSPSLLLFLLFFIIKRIGDDFHLLVHLLEHFINHLQYFLMGRIKASLVRLDKLLDVACAIGKIVLHFLLGVVLHFRQLLHALEFGGDDILDFGWFFCLLVELNVLNDALWAQWLNAVCSLADVGDGVVLVGGAGDGDKARGIGGIDGAHLAPTATG